MAVETDYLIVGAGASALSFVDVMLRESDATFTIVDRRAAPGGHWNDAYPFVRLHQPSAFYGVSSRPLGRDRKDAAGFNKGLYELASGPEVVSYFHALMQETFLPSGRVNYFPMSEHVGGGEVVSLLSGARQRVGINRKLVDATMLATSIPLTHKRQFAVAEGIACIPPNDLTRLAPGYAHYTVLGAGKTAIDSVLWLLDNGAPADAISWVLPRDQWLWNRVATQPGLEFFDQSLGAVARQYEACAEASSIEDLCLRMEAAGIWLRLDKSIWPTMLHGATVSEIELEHLRNLKNTIRLGRVQRIERNAIILDRGEAPADPDTLYVDCTARALAGNVRSTTPVFEPGKIALQMIRTFQPTFSAALIGHIEATISDEAEKQNLARVAPMADTVHDWITTQAASMTNQYFWARNPALDAWISACRLDAYGATLAQIRPDDADKLAILGRIRGNAGTAVQNLQKLAASVA